MQRVDDVVFRVVRALTGSKWVVDCRRCGEGIEAADPFGASEGVCLPCRGRQFSRPSVGA